MTSLQHLFQKYFLCHRARESKSAFEDTLLSTASSSATPKPTPAQDKLLADIDTLTKKIKWHKSDERESAWKLKHHLQNQAEQKKKVRNQKKQKVQKLMEKRQKITAELFWLTTTE